VRLEEAMGVLGIGPGATSVEVRAAYRRLIRDHHPDLDSTTDATRRTAELTQAYALVQRQLASSPDGRIEAAPDPLVPPPAATSVPVKEIDGDSILLDVPADEAFAALFEAAGRVGHVAYFDRQLGILETVVRFEGGPSCSVLITLQGRAHGTEAFCTMESIEAAPTPPIGPVVDALVEELAARPT
jgi:DnaJ domain